jgi:hypothetical protein
VFSVHSKGTNRGRQTAREMGDWMDNRHLEEQNVGGRILLNCITSCPFARYKNISRVGGVVPHFLNIYLKGFGHLHGMDGRTDGHKDLSS